MLQKIKYLSSILAKPWFVTEDSFIGFKGSYSHCSLESFKFLAPVLLNINLAKKNMLKYLLSPLWNSAKHRVTVDTALSNHPLSLSDMHCICPTLASLHPVSKNPPPELYIILRCQSELFPFPAPPSLLGLLFLVLCHSLSPDHELYPTPAPGQ